MNLLEKVGNFISKRGDYIQEQISGKRVFSAHITNATDEAGGTGTKIIQNLCDLTETPSRGGINCQGLYELECYLYVMPVLNAQFCTSFLQCFQSPPLLWCFRDVEIGWLAHYFCKSVVEYCLYCKDDHGGLPTATMAFGGLGAFRKTHGELWQVPLACFCKQILVDILMM